MTTEEKKILQEKAEAAERMATLNAMERVVLKLGGRKEYAAWLDVYPDNAELTGAGGVSREARLSLASDADAYARAEKAFAAIMYPTLAEMTKE